MPKNHIHLVNNLILEDGGVTRFLLELIDAKTHKQRVLFLANTNIERAEVQRLKFYTILQWFLGRYEGGENLFHIHGMWCWQLDFLSIILRLRGYKVVHHVHGMLTKEALCKNRKKKIIYLALWRLLNPATTLVVTSKWEESVIQTGVNSNIKILPLGLAIKSHPRKTYEKDVINFVFLGRIHPIKGIEELISAFVLLKDYRNWVLNIYGNDEIGLIDQFKSIIVKEELTDRIIFHGFISADKVKNVLAEDVILLAPSRTENFSFAIAEALSYGVPVVTTTGTPWQSINDNACGFVVDLSVENLRSVIEKLLNMKVSELSNISDRCKYMHPDISIKSTLEGLEKL